MTKYQTALLLLSMLPAVVTAFSSAFGHSLKQDGRHAVRVNAGSVIELDDQNFRSVLKGDKPVLVDCMAVWCGPCRLIEPVLDRCAEKSGEDLVVCRYDVQSRNHELKVELLLHGVMPRALPFLILFQNNKVLTTYEGLLSDAELEDLLKDNIIPNKTELPEPAMAAERASGYISFAPTADDYMLTP